MHLPNKAIGTALGPLIQVPDPDLGTMPRAEDGDWREEVSLVEHQQWLALGGCKRCGCTGCEDEEGTALCKNSPLGCCIYHLLVQRTGHGIGTTRGLYLEVVMEKLKLSIYDLK